MIPRDKRIPNPLEEKIAAELRRLGIAFEQEGEGSTQNLDFRIVGDEVYLEVKAFHSDRIAGQMARVENVIAIQGIKAVDWFVSILSRLPAKEEDK